MKSFAPNGLAFPGFYNDSGRAKGPEREIKRGKQLFSDALSKTYFFWKEQYKQIPRDDTKARIAFLEKAIRNIDKVIDKARKNLLTHVVDDAEKQKRKMSDIKARLEMRMEKQGK